MIPQIGVPRGPLSDHNPSDATCESRTRNRQRPDHEPRAAGAADPDRSDPRHRRRCRPGAPPDRGRHGDRLSGRRHRATLRGRIAVREGGRRLDRCAGVRGAVCRAGIPWSPAVLVAGPDHCPRSDDARVHQAGVVTPAHRRGGATGRQAQDRPAGRGGDCGAGVAGDRAGARSRCGGTAGRRRSRRLDRLSVLVCRTDRGPPRLGRAHGQHLRHVPEPVACCSS